MTEVDSRAQPSVRRAELSDLRTVLDAVQAYIFTKDLEGRYTYANRQVCELFGRPLEQVLGQRDEAFFGGAGLSDVQSADQKVLATGHPYEQMETLEPAGAGRDFVGCGAGGRGNSRDPSAPGQEFSCHHRSYRG